MRRSAAGSHQTDAITYFLGCSYWHRQEKDAHSVILLATGFLGVLDRHTARLYRRQNPLHPDLAYLRRGPSCGFSSYQP